MPYDPEERIRILNILDTSDDPEAPAITQLVRDMELTIKQLRTVLSCASALAEGRLEPCQFYWDGNQCVCEKCGQLASAWGLKAASAMKSLSDFSPAFEAESSPEELSGLPAPVQLKPEQVLGVLTHLEGAVKELVPSVTGGTAPQPTVETRHCAGCGTSLAASVRFCPECGRTATGQALCLNCNAPIDPESNFCPKCGAKAA